MEKEERMAAHTLTWPAEIYQKLKIIATRREMNLRQLFRDMALREIRRAEKRGELP